MGDLMKKLIALTVLTLSVNTFAASFVGTTLLPTESLALTTAASSGNPQKQAALIINDTQEYMQSGVMTPFLSQKIKDIQAQDSSVSDQEALDALVSVSEQILR